MRLIKNTTELIGIKDPNIIISLVFETDTHIEVQAKLDYPVYETTFWSIHWKSDNRYNLSRWICLELIFHWLAKIVPDRFHIIQNLGRAFLKTRIAIMNQFNKNSLPYWDLKNHWRLFQKDSRKLSLNSFYSKTFRQTLVPHGILLKRYFLVSTLLTKIMVK